VANVAVGADVAVGALTDWYDAVVLAHGAGEDRLLGVPGEQLRGVVGAREFVGWYNGDPGAADLPIDLDCERAAVVGMGNVALDVARILLTPVDRLRTTDMAAHALDALARSRIRRVDLVGRRGPVQVAFTIKELRELTTLPGVRAHVHNAARAAQLLSDARPTWEQERARRRLLELLDKLTRASLAAGAADHQPPQWTLRFLQTPVAIEADAATGTRAAGVRLAANRLDPHTQMAVPDDGPEEVVPAGLVVRSIGYRNRALPGVPFDARAGTVAHVGGRVGPRLYVAGWLATGPVGVLATTLANAHATADAVLADWTDEAARGVPAERPGWAALQQQLRKVAVVGYDGWRAIDAEERRRGTLRGAERDKLVRHADLLAVAATAV
jgi:NADPH-dependent glutamate synthase beta subunit-like oxidoreductase